ncbi:MAG: diguanylate cyclase [Okeania sp. SIO2C9]|uniref:diguanylate cyclase domain-containing protein n=1 Tax=Okeania sp. SIO2C9 TaxID=2607791 RepID=UPI0013C10A6B|nr:diguanylate cyclase [Okeania sp. SIO2C9]NEQ72531.1 diguanylate cyclase [Okeania sp. SIO2C9]
MNSKQSQNNATVIMIVDDEKLTRYLLHQALQKEGYQIIEAKNGKQCLEMCSIQIPDLILLDAMMPEMNGFNCCIKLQELFSKDLSNNLSLDQKLDSNPLLYRTPVLMITTLEDQESIDLAFAVGALDYITKPVKFAVLRQRVRRILQINQLVKELRKQTERSRLMSLVQERIRQSLNLNDILKNTVDEVRNFLKTDRVLIYKFNPDGTGEVLMESIASGLQSVIENMSINSYYNNDNLQPTNLTKNIAIANLIPYHIEFLTRFKVKSNLVVPISKINKEQFSDQDFDYSREELWGLLIAHHCSKLRKWQSSEIESIEHLARQLAIALQQSELYQQLETANEKLFQFATLDGLTKIANRRLFDQYIHREWRRMAREKAPISLIFCDVDYFKLYNDTYGHPAGDKCLQKIAKAIKAKVKRPGDLVARYGGEEFVVVLPRTDAKGGYYVAESIRRRVMNLNLVNTASKVSPFVTLSLGVASAIPLPEFPLEKLIKTADEALYQAKQEGRNMTIVRIV